MTRRSTVARRSRTAIGVLLAVTAASACAPDQGVLSIGAEPAAEPSTTAPATTTVPEPPTSEPTGEATETTPPSDDTGDTGDTGTETVDEPDLPPIVEPELAVEIPIEEVVDVGDRKKPREHDTFVAVAFTDIERWWSEVFPAVYGGEFVPLSGGIFAGYPGRSDDLPGCGEPRTDYQDLNLYVAFYCQFDDFMIYDDGDQSLLTQLAEEYGPAVMGIVLAHEYGHTIQQRTGALDRFLPTIITEQQADCFAGAWAGQAYRGESPLLRLGDRDVRTGLVAMLNVSDPIGTDQFSQGGHGSAFDRAGAFQEGFVDGPGRCAELLDDPLPLMPNQFLDFSDASREGNASYDCSDDPDPNCTPAPAFLAEDLNDFWPAVLPGFEPLTPAPVADLDSVGCAEPVEVAELALVCENERVVAYQEPDVLELYRQIGDFSLGYLYGVSWAEVAQRTLGTGLSGERRALLNDCFVGAWTRDITLGLRYTEREGTALISAGDLDEAIQMAILTGDEGANVDVNGSPFEKIESFRVGVLGGYDACTARFLR